MKLDELFAELESFSVENDKSQSDRARRMLNITRDTGQMLGVLVKTAGSRHILEIGTSNGYSTLWLAHAAQALGGTVTTVECSEYKISLAKANFERAGLHGLITQVDDEAISVLARLPDAEYDFIFLDSERSAYPRWWPHVRRALRPRGILVVDNATSHSSEVHPFITLVESDSDFTSCLVPIGHGEFLAVKIGQ
jgi:predicted O-methyltransferase YrrM